MGTKLASGDVGAPTPTDPFGCRIRASPSTVRSGMQFLFLQRSWSPMGGESLPPLWQMGLYLRLQQLFGIPCGVNQIKVWHTLACAVGWEAMV